MQPPNNNPVNPAAADPAHLQIAEEIYKKLSAPFPEEALSKDSSRGFDLTSVKAQYVVERLNDVLGIDGWRVTGEYEYIKDKEGTIEDVVFHGKLLIRIGRLWHIIESVGHSEMKKHVGDSLKGARTDFLSKAASLVGVANDVFKGKVKPPGSSQTSYSSSFKPKPKTNPFGG